MENIIYILAGVASITYLLGITLKKNGIAACFSAISFIAWIGFAYIGTEYVPEIDAQVVLYSLSAFPLLNAICQYTRWIIELRKEANWQFLQEQLGLIREASMAATTDAKSPIDSRQAACMQFFKEYLPRLVTKLGPKPANDS